MKLGLMTYQHTDICSLLTLQSLTNLKVLLLSLNSNRYEKDWNSGYWFMPIVAHLTISHDHLKAVNSYLFTYRQVKCVCQVFSSRSSLEHRKSCLLVKSGDYVVLFCFGMPFGKCSPNFHVTFTLEALIKSVSHALQNRKNSEIQSCTTRIYDDDWWPQWQPH